MLGLESPKVSQNPICRKIEWIRKKFVGNFENSSWITIKMEKKVIGA